MSFFINYFIYLIYIIYFVDKKDYLALDKPYVLIFRSFLMENLSRAEVSQILIL